MEDALHLKFLTEKVMVLSMNRRSIQQLWSQPLGGTDVLCLSSFGPEYRHDPTNALGGPGI